MAEEQHAARTPKRRRTEGGQDIHAVDGGASTSQETQMGASTMEATDPGAVGELTGPIEPRQEQ